MKCVNDEVLVTSEPFGLPLTLFIFIIIKIKSTALARGEGLELRELVDEGEGPRVGVVKTTRGKASTRGK